MPDDEQQTSPLEKAQEAIDDARDAARDALPSDPLEGTAPVDDRTADQQADDEELED